MPVARPYSDMTACLKRSARELITQSEGPEALNLHPEQPSRVGLEHGEIELPIGPGDQRLADWSLTEGMLISTHLHIGGSTDDRYWLEDVALVESDEARSIYEWDFLPLRPTAG